MESVGRGGPTCQILKPYTGKTKEKTCELMSPRPLDDIYMDFWGPLPAVNGKKYILGIIDRFSRYISLTAVSNQDEVTVIKTF